MSDKSAKKVTVVFFSSRGLESASVKLFNAGSIADGISSIKKDKFLPKGEKLQESYKIVFPEEAAQNPDMLVSDLPTEHCIAMVEMTGQVAVNTSSSFSVTWNPFYEVVNDLPGTRPSAPFSGPPTETKAKVDNRLQIPTSSPGVTKNSSGETNTLVIGVCSDSVSTHMAFNNQAIGTVAKSISKKLTNQRPSVKINYEGFRQLYPPELPWAALLRNKNRKLSELRSDVVVLELPSQNRSGPSFAPASSALEESTKSLSYPSQSASLMPAMGAESAAVDEPLIAKPPSSFSVPSHYTAVLDAGSEESSKAAHTEETPKTTSSVSSTQSSAQGLPEKYKKCVADLVEAKKRISALEAEKAELEAVAGENNKTMEANKEKIEIQHKTMEANKEKIEILIVRIRELGAERDKLIREQTELFKQLEYERIKRELGLTSILEEQSRRARIQSDALRAEIKALTDESHAQQAKIKALTDESHTQQAKIKALTDESHAQQAEIKLLRNELNTAREEITVLAAEFSKFREIFDPFKRFLGLAVPQ